MIQRLRRLIESSRRFVPQPFLNALGKSDITDVAIGDATLRDMTVLFMDIRGFTPLSERMTADENLRFLNSLLERILPSIERNNGFVDKYMGDAMMALFADCPDDAVRAGIGLQEAVVAYNEERRAAGEPTVTVGVGINSGELILGTLGSGTRLDTTVIGSIVNVAARVEKLTKDFGVPLIVPAGVAEALRDDTRSQLSTRDLGAVQIRGVADEVRLVGVLVDGWTQEG
jgi:class 3 adenylate cyclase